MVALIAFIISLASDLINEFTGWSISYAIVGFSILIYGLSDLVSDLVNADEEPIYFSPWVFPVFKYIPKKNDIVMKNQPAALVMVFFFMLLAWAIQCSVWITPFTSGIAVTCLAEVLFLIFVLYLISFTPVLLEDVRPSIDQLIIKRAWLEAKSDYVTTKHIQDPEAMITFSEICQKRNDILNHIKRMRKDPTFTHDARVSYSWNTRHIDATSLRKCK